MIRLLSGTAVSVQGNTLVIETAGGVGYLVTVPTRSHILPDEQVRLHTYLAVRETALDLYGFLEPADVTCFEALLTISGIGPKSAMQILDQADRALIAEAVQLEDAAHLTKLSGISKKTAEKIVMGLQGKLDTTLLSVTPRTHTHTHYEDAFDTLVTLGYNPQAIRQVLDQLPPEDSTSSLVKAAFKLLS